MDPFETFELGPETLRFLIEHARRDLRLRSARSAPPVGEEDIHHVNMPPVCDDGWGVSRLQAEGIAPSPTAELFARVRRGDYVGIDGLLIARNGLLVAETYFFAGFQRLSLHQTRSCFKAATGLRTGIAIADGLLALDDPVAPLLAR